jgi:hypothetical protein
MGFARGPRIEIAYKILIVKAEPRRRAPGPVLPAAGPVLN